MYREDCTKTTITIFFSHFYTVHFQRFLSEVLIKKSSLRMLYNTYSIHFLRFFAKILNQLNFRAKNIGSILSFWVEEFFFSKFHWNVSSFSTKFHRFYSEYKSDAETFRLWYHRYKIGPFRIGYLKQGKIQRFIRL